MSIPVTLYAVIKCPQLLEGSAALVFQKYQQTVRDFNLELCSKKEKSKSGTGLMEGVEERESGGVMDVEDWSYSVSVGMKRKRTD